MTTFMPQNEAPCAPVVPGPFVQQGLAIQARLQLAFPPTKFYFKVLPPRIDAKKWARLTQGNQPFVGLGFNGFVPRKEVSGVLRGDASWMVLTAVRRDSTTDEARYYGDAFGIGALTMAPVAAAILHGYVCAGGTAQVDRLANVAADEWGDDAVICQVDLRIPTDLPLADMIINPGGAGWFGEMIDTWSWTVADGTAGSSTSVWKNPNVPQ